MTLPTPVPVSDAAAVCAPVGPLAHVPLFARLDPAEQLVLLGLMRRETYTANQIIFWHGEPGERLYLIHAGRVGVTVPNDQGEHIALSALGPGGFFGEISMLDGGPRTATTRALEDCELLGLHRDDFHAFLRSRPDAIADLLEVVGQRQRANLDALRHVPNPNQVYENAMTVWQRSSDAIASVAASPWFTMFHLAWFAAWIGINTIGPLVLFQRITVPEGVDRPAWLFDPFPFGLLTMVVSLEAIYLSIFVMVSQNRQSEKDRLRTDLDYQVNVRAHTEVLSINRRLERIESALAIPTKPAPPADPPRA